MYLFVYCSGGFGKEVMDIARRVQQAQPRWDGLAFLDDRSEAPTAYSTQMFRLQEALDRFGAGGMEVVIANGEPAIRRELREKLAKVGVRLATVVDPSAVVSASARLEDGVILFPFCFVSSDAVVGTNTALIAGTTFGHDSVVGEDCVIAGQVNIGGNCDIGARTYVGMGAQVKQGIRIGRETIVGMGSVVHNDLPDQMVALGNPCRPMRPNTTKRVFG